MQSLSKAEAKIGNLASTLGPLEPSVSGSTACGRPDSYAKIALSATYYSEAPNSTSSSEYRRLDKTHQADGSRTARARACGRHIWGHSQSH